MKTTIESTLQAEYSLRIPESPRQIIILVHGYLENGERILKSLEDVLPSDAIILSPNGPFPVPFEKRGKRRLGFAWYFFDREEKRYLFDYDIPSSFLCNLIKQLELPDLPLTVIGHSQGGYLAPFFFERYSGKIKRFIGIGCEVRHSLLKKKITYPVDLIHGDLDIIVNPEHARASISNIENSEMHMIKDDGHRISVEMAQKVQELL